MGKIFDWKKTINKLEFDETISALKNGDLVVFPTETVYGIGANALDEEAIRKIYIAKCRPQDNPLTVHVSDEKMLRECVKKINKTEQELIDAFMPGPFTLILEKSDKIPKIVSAGLDTIGVRMPNNEIANKIIKCAKIPVVGTSANISGKPSGTNLIDIKDELLNKVLIMIDGGESDIGLESTVVKVVDDVPVILRPRQNFKRRY